MGKLKILVVSDSHGDHQIISDLIDRYDHQVDGIFHCGDSELDLTDPLIPHLHIVKGNMDHAAFANQELVTLDQQTILLTHGHLQNVNTGLLNLELLAKSEAAKIVLYGHTHQLGVVKDQGILFINPGSISFPRGQYAYLGGTYAIVSLENFHLIVQFYDRKFNALNNLRFCF